MLNKNIALLILLTSFIPFSAVLADGASLTKNTCGICHGNDGNSFDPKVPSIAGFSEETLEDILEQFKSGDRVGIKHKNTDMGVIANSLSEADSEAIITFLASQTFKPHQQKVDASLVSKGKTLHDTLCSKCHTDNGSNAEDAPILAGQWAEYLRSAFVKIMAGDRDVSKKMMKKMKKLSADDQTALIEFYASQQ